MIRAFTLIELLVVVAITTVLISILLPSLSGSRTRAKITVCESNQRQIALAVSMYRDGSKRDVYPRTWLDIEDDVYGVRSCTLDRDRVDYNLWPVLFLAESTIRFEEFIDTANRSRTTRKPHPVTADRLMGNGQQHHGYRKWSAARPDGSVGEWKYPQFP